MLFTLFNNIFCLNTCRCLFRRLDRSNRLKALNDILHDIYLAQIQLLRKRGVEITCQNCNRMDDFFNCLIMIRANPRFYWAQGYIRARLPNEALFLKLSHVAELHVKHAAKAVSGQSKSHSDALLQRFKESFHSLSLDKVKPWKWPKEGSFLAQANAARMWAEDALIYNVFPRADSR